MMSVDALSLLTYGLLFLTVISLWLPSYKNMPLWPTLLTASLSAGLLSSRLQLIGLGSIAMLVVFAFGLQKKSMNQWLRILSGLAVLLFAALLEIHALPGFHNLKVLNQVMVSQHGIPFSLYWNIDKVAVGILIIGMLTQRIATPAEWWGMLKITLPRVPVVCVIVGCLAWAFGLVAFDPKLPNHFLIWSITNLLFVCMAEEALLRGFIQKYLGVLLRRFRFGAFVALILASTLFGLAHYVGGTRYMVVATIAGLGYGWIYMRTQRIEASIITHFLLNLLHFLLLTYPMLTPSYS